MVSDTNIARVASAAFLATLLSACGGGGGGGSSTPAPPPPPAVDNTLSSTHKPLLTGRLLDSPVAGLRYSSVAGSGTTDADGKFTYMPGELITFKIGDIALPPVVGRPILLVEDFAYYRPARLNIPRLLQSLDSDGNPDNGITISEKAHSAATGRNLDFSSRDQFEIDGNALVLAAGGAKTELISSDEAFEHAEAVRAALPLANPVVGGWITASEGDSRALLLLENGLYYSMEANCNGVPNYEYGKYTYADGKIAFTAIVDADGSACGMNTGSRAVTFNAGILDLAGDDWTSVGTGIGNGVFYAGGTLGNPTDHGFTLVLLGQNSVAALGTSCGGGAVVEFGNYDWQMLYDFEDIFVLRTESTITASSSNTCSPSSLVGLMMARTKQSFFEVMGNGPSVSPLIEIVPSSLGGTLVGGWIAKPSSGITFTSDGRYLFNTDDAACRDSDARSTGEKGTFSWDTVTNAASVKIDIETDGACGYAYPTNSGSSAISKLEVAGNLLTVTHGSRQDVLVRNVDIEGWSGTWTRPASADSPRLTFSSAYKGIRVNISNPYGVSGEAVSVSSLDSDCATAQSFVIEDVNLVVNANGVTDAIATDSSSWVAVPHDQPGCGLPVDAGPEYKFSGDSLHIDGWGTFIREM